MSVNIKVLKYDGMTADVEFTNLDGTNPEYDRLWVGQNFAYGADLISFLLLLVPAVAVYIVASKTSDIKLILATLLVSVFVTNFIFRLNSKYQEKMSIVKILRSYKDKYGVAWLIKIPELQCYALVEKVLNKTEAEIKEITAYSKITL
jgi:hypothetical protein